MPAFNGSVINLINRLPGEHTVIPLPIPFVQLLGDYESAAFLTMVVIWSEQLGDADGWFSKSHEEWQIELFLSAKQIRRCTRNCATLVEVRRKGLPARNYYRPNKEGIVLALQSLEDPGAATWRPVKAVDHE